MKTAVIVGLLCLVAYAAGQYCDPAACDESCPGYGYCENGEVCVCTKVHPKILCDIDLTCIEACYELGFPGGVCTNGTCECMDQMLSGAAEARFAWPCDMGGNLTCNVTCLYLGFGGGGVCDEIDFCVCRNATDDAGYIKDPGSCNLDTCTVICEKEGNCDESSVCICGNDDKYCDQEASVNCELTCKAQGHVKWRCDLSNMCFCITD